jgi:hypothetical protein
MEKPDSLSLKVHLPKEVMIGASCSAAVDFQMTPWLCIAIMNTDPSELNTQ